MKIPILISSLTDSPYSVRTKSSFHFDDNESLDQLATSISKANPTSFLISGYRGVGKTSFVNRLHEKLGAKTVFVNLSVARYDGYPVLIKRLIRQLYHSYKIVRTETPDEHESKMRTEFDLLYDRTFHDVTNTRKNFESTSEKKQHSLAFDLGKILTPLTASVFSGFNIHYNFIESELAAVILFIIALSWTVTSAIQFSVTKTSNKDDLNETLRKTLYDDEIAEHHLFEILAKLKQQNYQIVIVFDELDKIKSIDIVDKIINDIKVLLLSGHANFFVIAGQGLYYQLETASGTDDAVVSSLFSKKIHIPFLTNASLRSYVYSLIEDQNMLAEKLVNNFIDSLILESSRIPRRLSNLLRDLVFWEDGKPYIFVNEERADFYEKEARLLTILSKIADSDLYSLTTNPVKLDFFTAHLHMWLIKMKTFQANDFSVRQIVDRDPLNMNDSQYPPRYLAQLLPLGEQFFDKLKTAELLIINQGKNDSVPFFAWNANVQIDVQDTITVGQEIEATFLQEFADLERTVRLIYHSGYIGQGAVKAISLRQMIKNMVNAGILRDRWTSFKVLDELITVRNKVSHGASVSDEEKRIIEKSRFNINRTRSELTEEYFYYVVKNYLKDYSFTTNEPFDAGFDFTATDKKTNLLFEVKHILRGGAVRGSTLELAERIVNHAKVNTGNNFYIVFVPQTKASHHVRSFSSQFHDTMRALNSQLSLRTFLIYASENETEFAPAYIEDLIQGVLNNIAELTPRSLLFAGGALSMMVPDQYYRDAEQKIRERVKQQWPDDFVMQGHEIENQLDAVESLKKPKPADLSQEQFNLIQLKAREQWPDDYAMQLYEQVSQIEALRKLNNKQ